MVRNKYGWVSGLILVSVFMLLHGISRAEEARYANQSYGISFPLPEDTRLYTPENPGPFTFEKGTMFILVNRWKPSEFIMLHLSSANDEKALQDLKTVLDSKGLPQPGYSKVSVQFTTLGENQQKRALEHIFDLQKQIPRTMRQLSFIHKGQGFIFVCTTSAGHFQEANRAFFEPVFRSIKFE